MAVNGVGRTREQQIDGARIHGPQDEAQLRELGRVGDRREGLTGESCPPVGVATDERLGEGDEDGLLARRPAAWRRRRVGGQLGRSQPCAGHGSQRIGRSSR